MDDELRGLERAWAQEGSIAALRALLRGLTRAGRSAEVLALVRGRLEVLGAERFLDLDVGPRHVQGADGTSQKIPCWLRGWRLPPDLGGCVLVELPEGARLLLGRRPVAELFEVVSSTRLVATHHAISGVVHGTQSVLGADGHEVIDVFHDGEGTPDRTEELEAALRRLAAAAGTSLEIEQGLKFWD